MLKQKLRKTCHGSSKRTRNACCGAGNAAKVVEAEAEVPQAMAYALREGKLGVLDYYHLQNLVADTDIER